MRAILTVLLVVISLVAVQAALADEPSKFSGEVSLKGVLTDVDGNEAKFNEYRDLNDGLYGRVKLQYDSDSYFMKFKGSDFGYDTQRYSLDGGMWGAFKYNFFYRELPHNLTNNAISPFTGVDSSHLGFDPAGAVDPANPATWPSRFDYETERKQFGGGVSLSVLKPFFINVDASREIRDGVKPAGFAAGGSSAGTALELPEPIDYRTDMVKAEAGYARNPIFASVYMMYSEFRNNDEVLTFNNPFAGGARDFITLPPDNEYYKMGFKGALKLPLRSKLNVAASRGKATSDGQLWDTGLVSLGEFDGEVVTTNYDVALTTNPVSFLDAKVFYKYYKRDNRSDVIDDGNSPNILFDYLKHRAGGELGFRLPLHFYLSGGYANVRTKRNFNGDTDDDVYSADLRWNGMDFVTVRTGYERLDRDSSLHDPLDLSTGLENATGAVNFDVAEKTRDTFKVAFDLYPTDFLNFGIGYKYKDTDYKNLEFGLKGDRRHEVYVNGDAAIGKLAQLFGYFDYERVTFRQDQSNGGAEWSSKQKEKYYDFGVGTNIFLLPKKLTLRLQYDYVKSNGDNDLTLSDTALATLQAAVPGANNGNVDISNWDDYRKQSYLAKLIYDVSKKFTLAVGYIYEKFTYDDIQLDNYQLVTTGALSDAALTGAFRDLSYRANVVFASVTYRIW